MSETLNRTDGSTVTAYSLEELRTVNPEMFARNLSEARESRESGGRDMGIAVDDLSDDEYVERDVEEGWRYCSEGCALGMEDDGFDADDCEH
jgi:hypothetical protein